MNEEVRQPLDANRDEILSLYEAHQPSGELVLPYLIPKGETFQPQFSERFLNVSKFFFRSQSLWLVSFWCVVYPLLASTFILIGTAANYDSAHHHHHHHHHHLLNAASVQPHSADSLLLATTLGAFSGIFFFVLGFLALLAIGLAFYAVCASVNLRSRFGSVWIDRLAAPTEIALSKDSLKLFWSGKWFAQHGAVLSWRNVHALDYTLDESDTTVAPVVIVKYRLLDNWYRTKEEVLPFSLGGFASLEQAKFFLTFLNKHVSADVKTDSFKQAVDRMDDTLALVEQCSPEVLLEDKSTHLHTAIEFSANLDQESSKIKVPEEKIFEPHR
jgi:hypothetical protein